MGRKITYAKAKEEELLEYAMVAREEDGQFTLKRLKEKAREIIDDNEEFKGSDGWAKKFCARNALDLANRFNLPKTIPP